LKRWKGLWLTLNFDHWNKPWTPWLKHRTVGDIHTYQRKSTTTDVKSETTYTRSTSARVVKARIYPIFQRTSAAFAILKNTSSEFFREHISFESSDLLTMWWTWSWRAVYYTSSDLRTIEVRSSKIIMLGSCLIRKVTANMKHLKRTISLILIPIPDGVQRQTVIQLSKEKQIRKS